MKHSVPSKAETVWAHTLSNPMNEKEVIRGIIWINCLAVHSLSL